MTLLQPPSNPHNRLTLSLGELLAPRGPEGLDMPVPPGGVRVRRVRALGDGVEGGGVGGRGHEALKVRLVGQERLELLEPGGGLEVAERHDDGSEEEALKLEDLES